MMASRDKFGQWQFVVITAAGPNIDRDPTKKPFAGRTCEGLSLEANMTIVVFGSFLR
jgi:hypothetical protein